MGQAAMLGMLSAWNQGVKPEAVGSGMASTATADATSSTSSAADAGVGITANDFLTLLVTEMQNQDPTADVDPNSYINQLVQINSLEQLISINQNTTPATGSSSSGSGTTGPGSSTGAVTASTGVTGSAFTAGPDVLARSAASGTALPIGVTGTAAAMRAGVQVVHGNMSPPPVSGAAETVAGALAHPASAGRSIRPAGYGHAIRDIPVPGTLISR